jgi:glycosyltransferase involved in cell wall biosynthesis
MAKRPGVSVVVPTFQGELRIGAALTRLQQQSHTDFEVVVVDDGSTDATPAVVREAMSRDGRIRLIEQDHAGIAAARNRAIEAARSDVLAFLDDDDHWHVQKLELQLARLAAAPQVALVSCYSALVDFEAKLLGWRIGGSTEGDVYREMLEWDMVSGGSVALAVRSAVEEAGGFDESLADRADWDLWIRLARRSPFACVDRVLVGYTRRSGSVSQDSERMLAQGRKVLAKARSMDPNIGARHHRALIARDLFAASCFCLFDECGRAGCRYMAAALRTEPFIVLRSPRRLAVIMLLLLATVLPKRSYWTVLTVFSRVAFGLKRGRSFESLPLA